MTQKKLVNDTTTVKNIKDILKEHIRRFEIDLKDETLEKQHLTEKELTEILIKHYKLVLALMEKL